MTEWEYAEELLKSIVGLDAVEATSLIEDALEDAYRRGTRDALQEIA